MTRPKGDPWAAVPGFGDEGHLVLVQVDADEFQVGVLHGQIPLQHAEAAAQRQDAPASPPQLGLERADRRHDKPGDDEGAGHRWSTPVGGDRRAKRGEFHRAARAMEGHRILPVHLAERLRTPEN